MKFQPRTKDQLQTGYHWAVRPRRHGTASLLIGGPQVVRVRWQDQKLQVFTCAGPEPQSVDVFWFGDFVGTDQHDEAFYAGNAQFPEAVTISRQELKEGWHPGA